jgi:hypothetical protein
MAKYMNNKDIQAYLEEGLEEEGTVEKAFDYLLENEIRDLFEMNDWDEPKFTDLVIKFKNINYKISIKSIDCIEATNSHRIMEWEWVVNVI